MNYKEMIKTCSKLQEKHCFKCKHFYEGFICGFELSSNKVEDKIEDIMERRKDVCSLDKEPFEVRSKIYINLGDK